MSKIAIFYHVYQVGDWENIFIQQIDRMKKSGLFDAAEFIHIGVNGEYSLPVFPEKVKIVRNQEEQFEESPTLKSIFDFCKTNVDYNVLYIHTSGVSWSVDTSVELNRMFYVNKTLWRQYQEYFVIDLWRACNSLLKSYDCVGTEWKTDGWINAIHYLDVKHYSGNIWWAKSEYINKLQWDYTINSEFGRYASEFLIGTGKPNHYSFYSSNRNLYYSPIYEDEYRLCV